jgi:hypothetical protein
MRSPAASRTFELFGEPVKECRPVALRLIADVVGQPGKAIDRQEMSANSARQKSRGDGKILSTRLTQHRLGVGYEVWSRRHDALRRY